jgi:2-dehydro-3-deoxygluconokinase
VKAAPRVLCIGETMGMVTSRDASPLARADLFTLTQGGAESNVAQHLAELGLDVAWASALGADPVGDRILAALDASGVDTRWVRRDPDAATGLYLKDPGAGVHSHRAGSAASRLGADDVAAWPIADAEWVHVSGITPALSATCRELLPAVLAAARSGGTRVSFDVNYRPSLWSAAAAAEVVRPLADQADLVFVGRDEAHVLWHTDAAEEVAALFPHPDLVVVKDAAVEAVELRRGASGEVITRVPAKKVHVVEEVGAGDAFAGGYLAALLAGADAAERLQTGHDLAAWVLGVPGDHRPAGQRTTA